MNYIKHIIPPLGVDPAVIKIVDHCGGFSQDLKNLILDEIDGIYPGQKIVTAEFVADDRLKKSYPDIKFQFDDRALLSELQAYNQHPTINYKNFICSFNGSEHVSRKFLTAILQKFGYFDLGYCSKNLCYSVDVLDGHLSDYVTNDNFYRKFFIGKNSEEYFQLINSFDYARFTHDSNIHVLESRLTESFLHLVSESMATSYYPFVTEKFLYSVVTRGLFLAYAQPGWHTHVEGYYGFRRYDKLFDYRFDTIVNPVERLLELVTMVSKFSHLSPADWHDLYLIELDTVEYNYDHYFSGKYLKGLENYE